MKKNRFGNVECSSDIQAINFNETIECLFKNNNFLNYCQEINLKDYDNDVGENLNKAFAGNYNNVILEPNWQKITDYFLARHQNMGNIITLISPPSSVIRESSDLFLNNFWIKCTQYGNKYNTDCADSMNMAKELTKINYKDLKLNDTTISLPDYNNLEDSDKILNKRTSSNCNIILPEIPNKYKYIKIFNTPDLINNLNSQKTKSNIITNYMNLIDANFKNTEELKKPSNWTHLVVDKKKIKLIEYLHIINNKPDFRNRFNDILSKNEITYNMCMACGGIITDNTPIQCDHVIPIMTAFTCIDLSGRIVSTKIKYEFSYLHSSCNNLKSDTPIEDFWKNISKPKNDYYKEPDISKTERDRLGFDTIKTAEERVDKLKHHLSYIYILNKEKQMLRIKSLIKIKLIDILTAFEHSRMVDPSNRIFNIPKNVNINVLIREKLSLLGIPDPWSILKRKEDEEVAQETGKQFTALAYASDIHYDEKYGNKASDMFYTPPIRGVDEHGIPIFRRQTSYSEFPSKFGSSKLKKLQIIAIKINLPYKKKSYEKLKLELEKIKKDSLKYNIKFSKNILQDIYKYKKLLKLAKKKNIRLTFLNSKNKRIYKSYNKLYNEIKKKY